MVGPVAGVFVPGAVNQVVVGCDGCRPAGVVVGRSFAVLGCGGWQGGYGRVDCLFRLVVDGRDGLQQSRSDFGPADEEEWADGVEGGLAVGAGDEWVGDVEGEGGEAGEGEQSAGWSELVHCGA